MALITVLAALLILTPETYAQSRQNPSPMVETARAHERIEPVEHPGMRRSVEVGLPHQTTERTNFLLSIDDHPT